MRKRIGTKLYDTSKGIPVIPGEGLYKQPSKRSFYLFDGSEITPLTIDQAETMIRGAGDPELMRFLEIKPSRKGTATVAVTVRHYLKLDRYARGRGRSMKNVIESFIDSLPNE